MCSRGFTLIELLVTLGIVGILASIAIPQYASYRERAYDASARHDLRNAVHGEELYFIDHDRYLSCDNLGCLESQGGLPGVRGLSDTVSLEIIAVNGDDPRYFGSASSSFGSGRTFNWDSANPDGDNMTVGQSG